MTPPLLRELDEFFREYLWLLETDPETFLRRLEGFTTFVVCRSYRAGIRDQLKRLRHPSEN